MTDPWPALLGGMLIGLSAATLLVFNGQVAGISDIIGRLTRGDQRITGAGFLLGLVVGPAAYLTISGSWPVVRVTAAWAVLIAAGRGLDPPVTGGCKK